MELFLPRGDLLYNGPDVVFCERTGSHSASKLDASRILYWEVGTMSIDSARQFLTRVAEDSCFRSELADRFNAGVVEDLRSLVSVFAVEQGFDIEPRFITNLTHGCCGYLIEEGLLNDSSLDETTRH